MGGKERRRKDWRKIKYIEKRYSKCGELSSRRRIIKDGSEAFSRIFKLSQPTERKSGEGRRKRIGDMR